MGLLFPAEVGNGEHNVEGRKPLGIKPRRLIGSDKLY